MHAVSAMMYNIIKSLDVKLITEKLFLKRGTRDCKKKQ